MTSNPATVRLERQISCLLVANRGEIARRVLRTCRTLGIATVAVFSDADADAPHVAEADVAVRLPGDTPAETYLRGDTVIEAAVEAGADAVHPGYGFLSESAEFARAVQHAGLTWVGPPPEAIASMGSKTASKRIMAEAGVPLLDVIDADEVSEGDLPVLVKASAGGGGRGMRVVRSLPDLQDRIRSASTEAASAFGDATVFCEPYVESGRHIEVQVMADEHGSVWAVGERECSIQRRHQKVVEEAPSPLVDAGMRERLFDAACTAATAIGYVGAGTVEFLATADGRFFFLEMNTRLQVEHPVTECVTGLDLVALQVRVAEGRRLPDDRPEPHGHAIEVRLYAEDPAAGWQPQSGTLRRLESRDVDAEFAVPANYGIRLDSGVRSGSLVSMHYDPMLAKVVSWAPSREEAARRLARALAGMKIHGLRTNRDLLVRVLGHPAFLSGDTDTAFFDRHGLEALSTPLADADSEALSALAAALAQAADNRCGARVAGGLPSGWRNVVSAPQRKRFTGVSGTHEVTYRLGRSGLVADGHDTASLVLAEPERVVLDVGRVRRTFAVARYGDLVSVDSALGSVELTRCERFPDPSAQTAPGSLLAPMPGTVTRVAVEQGEEVEAGQPLLWMEAMKMEHQVVAPVDGVVGALPAAAGHQVATGAVLAVVRAADSEE
ncbi:propionyl-CoA carboxylase alpha chain [Halopolyspora algeriensis]|uniref:Propionyl-CoA carboxylase alpha chain n=1 Tax=Halopolyspora algeriensis TaxID=1500506 RepID=A0A368VX30_9ACTN|nr:biotin carboxylase N-terminal domain-containing protein [Halopolyspora algeriensis]RCW45910.1 propionyl-CoA carboxylase alpha chain [Halopolyspora algeriensis]TQM55324.1 propionyl-CoA carboxylase alpha chain [Halopolyspora algeriensis]